MTQCLSCGAGLVPGGRFCGECGAAVVRPLAPPGPLPAAVAAPWPSAPPPTPDSPLGLFDGILHHLPVRELLPIHRWWAGGIPRQGGAALFLLMALAPFALVQITSDDTNVKRAAVGFAVYFAVLWLVAIRALVRPERLGWPAFVGIVAFTTVAGVAIAIAVEKQLDASTDTLLGSIVTIGLPEELAKALAILVFIRISGRRWSPRTYLYAGAVSGLAFGAAEAVTYTTEYASWLHLGDGGLAVSLWRLLSDGLFHACMAGIVAFFIGLGAWYRALRYQLVAFGLIVAGVLHGMYDHWSSGWGGAALAALIVVTFVGYVRSGDRIGARLEHHFSAAAPTG